MGPCTQVARDGQVMCGDFGNSLGTVDEVLVTGRLVLEPRGYRPAAYAPEHDVEQDEVEDEEVELRLRSLGGSMLRRTQVRTDDEGWLSERLSLGELGLEAGRYHVDVYAGEYWAARLQARLLPRDHPDPIVLSDIDLTYLNTDFQTASAAADLLGRTAAQREVLPAMEVVYPELRQGATERDSRPLTFLSGSPLFFRRTLAARMDLDAIEHDELLLKPMKPLLLNDLLDGLEASDVLAAVAGDIGALLPSLADQIGYKLAALLTHQLQIPASASVLLLGDDSESDPVIYALFHGFMSGELTLEELREVLDDLDVEGVWREAVDAVAQDALDSRGSRGSPVEAIFINETPVPNDDMPTEDWAVAGISRLHRGAWPLILECFEEGWVGEEAVQRVKARLEALELSSEALESAANAAVDAGYLATETVERFE